jgi:hypothetical protein
LILTDAEIVKLLEGYDKESKAIKEEALRICWHMRGSISYGDAMMLSQLEKELIANIIKDNMETTKKTNLPFF